MKLTKDEMAEAYELYTAGVYISNLALLFHVSETTMSKYLRQVELYGYALWREVNEQVEKTVQSTRRPRTRRRRDDCIACDGTGKREFELSEVPSFGKRPECEECRGTGTNLGGVL
jgi:DnaJ-class molecular chaperone